MRKRYVQIDGELVEVGPDYIPEPLAAHVIGDIEPYRSMVDGSMISGRSQHREHLKRHRLVEVGNDIPKRAYPRNTGAKEALVRTLQQAKEQHGSRNVELAISDALNKAYELRRR